MQASLPVLVLATAIIVYQPPPDPKSTGKAENKAEPKAMEPKADRKPEPNADAKADPKVMPKDTAKDQPRENPKGPEWPNEILGKTLDQWMKDLASTDPSTREVAIKAIRMFGPNARKAISPLVSELRRVNDVSVKAQAIIALGMIVPTALDQAKEPIEVLTKELNNPQGIIRLHACSSLAAIGPSARSTVPVLAKLTNDPVSWEIRRAACAALGMVGVDEQGWGDMRALTSLADAINDLSREVRIDAMQSIINLPPPAPGNNINQMKNYMERHTRTDKDKSVVIWARVALMRLDPTAINDANLTTIAKLLKNPESETRQQAAKALGVIGKDAKSKVPDLIDCLKSDDLALVIQACWSLGQMGPAANGAIQSLETLSQHKDEAVKTAAAEALKTIKTPPGAPGGGQGPVKR